MKEKCINHPDRDMLDNLDGDNLCHECCNAWAKAEATNEYPDELLDDKDIEIISGWQTDKM